MRSSTNVDNTAVRRQIEPSGLTLLVATDGKPIEVTLANGGLVHAAFYEHGSSFAAR